MPDNKPDSASLQQVRAYILAQDRHARVARELWNDGRFTYIDLRNYIINQKDGTSPSRVRHSIQSSDQDESMQAQPSPTSQAVPARTSPERSHPLRHQVSTSQLAVQPTAGYTFVGMRCVFDDTKCAVVLVKFANVRCDLLAYADIEGGLWLVRNIQDPAAAPIKAPQVHRRAITSLDWSRDNTYLLTAASDGLTVWDVADLAPVRTIATPSPANMFTAAIFHALSANMVLGGTASFMMEIINTSTGATTLSTPVFKKMQKGLAVTALECSAHHVFVGDSTGWLHVLKQEISRPGQLVRLVHMARLRIPASEATTPLIGVQYLAFCAATGTPALLVTARDSTIAIVKLIQEYGLLQLHSTYGVAPMAREICAWACPLSILHCDLPRIVIGSEETGVHIYNLSATKAPAANQRGQGTNWQLARPLLVNTLRGHRAPVAAVSWTFDEAFLASGDYDGMVIVWERATA